jgi:hypothetical protein
VAAATPAALAPVEPAREGIEEIIVTGTKRSTVSSAPMCSRSAR